MFDFGFEFGFGGYGSGDGAFGKGGGGGGTPVTPPDPPAPTIMAREFAIPFNRPLLDAFTQAGTATVAQMDDDFDQQPDPNGYREWLSFPQVVESNNEIAWFADRNAQSTGTENTGPQSNNPHTFAYIESSFAGAATAFSGVNIVVRNGGFLNTHTNRRIRLLYNAFGYGFRPGTGDDFEGIEVEQRDADGTHLLSTLLAGWRRAAGNGVSIDENGNPIAWNPGTADTARHPDSTLTPWRGSYGWAITPEITILGHTRAISIIPRFVTQGPGGAPRHDISIREIQFFYDETTPGNSGNSGFSDGFDGGFK